MTNKEFWIPVKLPICQISFRDLNECTDKVIRTVDSCKSSYHIDAVDKMIKSFHKMHESQELTTALYEYLSKKVKSLNKKHV